MNLRQRKKRFVNQFGFFDSRFPSMRKECKKLRSFIWNIRSYRLCK